MAGGFWGKVLMVDLSEGRIEEEAVGEEVYKKFLAGYGLAAKIAMERQRPNVDPLGEENILAFTAGVLTGTSALFSGRYMVSAKSPLSGGWGDANSGGSIGPAIKRAGYDGIFFKGKSEKPVYFLIDGDKKEIRQAEGLWGKDALQTEDLIHEELKDKKFKVAAIGMGGEKLSLISGIVSERGRIAARMGLGAVMGSKNLKALVLKGDKKVPVHNQEEMKRLNKDLLKIYKKGALITEDKLKTRWGRLVPLLGILTRYLPLCIKNDPLTMKFFLKRYGTCGFAGWCMESGDTPVKNWKGIEHIDFSLKKSRKITDEMVLKFQKKKEVCPNCPLGCGGVLEVKEGPYPLEEVLKPEYETLASLGNLCLNDNLYVIMKMNDLCNRAGIDTISLGGVLSFALECFEKGIISEKDTEGLRLNWGDGEALLRLTKKIIKREGIGEILADGVKRAAKKIGGGSEQFAIHAGGVELPMHDPRSDPGYGISYEAEPTPGKHLSSIAFQELMQLEKKFKEFKKSPLLYLKSKRYRIENKGRNQAFGGIYFQLFSCAGTCLFGPLSSGGKFPLFEWLNAATGWNFSPEEYREIGERIETIRHTFNLREGIKPEDFRIPPRAYGLPPLEAGNAAGVTLNMKALVKDFYKELDWDYNSGKPSRERLERLGLGEIIKEIY